MKVSLGCPSRRRRPRRLLLAAGLVLAVLAPAILGGSAAGAQPPPTIAGPLPSVPPISPLQGRAGGTEVTISFTTAEPSYVVIANEPTAPAAATGQLAGAVPNAAFQRDGGLTLPPPDPNAPPVPVPDRQVQATGPGTTHEFRFTGLTSNTGYIASVTTVPVSQPAERFHGSASYYTQKQRVRLVLDEITITEDGDWFGNGEPTWFWSVTWDGGTSGGCFPNTTASGVEHLVGVCQAGSYGEGTFVPRNDRNEKLALTFAEENFPALPTSFSLHAWSTEEDLLDPLIWLISQVGVDFTAPRAVMDPWLVPQDREWASQLITVTVPCDGCSLTTTMTFRFDLFHDNLPYPPNHGQAQIHSNF